jgi:flagellum-specific peptidoglycan hydrolase FlgJ
MSTQQSFIKKIAPHSVQAMREHGILASLTMAQAILESGWGKASIGNNIFGIKAGSGWNGKTQVVSTKEFLNGKWVNIQDKFRDYPSIVDSIKDHTSLFVRLSRYQPLRGEQDYKRACYLVWKCGYATDPEYPNKLIQIIEQYKLYEYDKDVKETITLTPDQEKLRQKAIKLRITDGKNPHREVNQFYAWQVAVPLAERIEELEARLNDLVKKK